MEVWVIQDGEKRGPMPDYEVRRRIAAGEFDAGTPAWHGGMDEWGTLGGLPMFEREFQLPFNGIGEPPQEELDEDFAVQQPPPLPQKPAFGRRFWARWLDLYAYSGLWWISLWAVGQDIGATLMNPWIILGQYIPWFVIETLLIHHFGTTPGKWLLGLRVTNEDGSRPSLAEATRRSSRVLFIGIGMGWWLPLSLICMLLAWFTAHRYGRPIWDQAGGHRVEVASLDPLRLVAFVLLLNVAMVVSWLVLAPYLLEAAYARNPALREQWESQPLRHFHLPKRD
jgi:uncharacterized RDD family membrane protein YckC